VFVYLFSTRSTRTVESRKRATEDVEAANKSSKECVLNRPTILAQERAVSVARFNGRRVYIDDERKKPVFDQRAYVATQVSDSPVISSRTLSPQV